jgi:hypothetical protein
VNENNNNNKNQIQSWSFIYKHGEHRQQSKGGKTHNYEPNEFDRMRVKQCLSKIWFLLLLLFSFTSLLTPHRTLVNAHKINKCAKFGSILLGSSSKFSTISFIFVNEINIIIGPCIPDCIIISYLIATPNNYRIIARSGY